MRLVSLGGLVVAMAMAVNAWGAEGVKIWEVGKADGKNAEFALAPRGYGKFTRDGFFVVGESQAKRDWPYVQPGPSDAWGGGRQHTFTILFGLKNAPPTGTYTLEIALLDAQWQGAPRVRVEVNGKTFEKALANGPGDESVNGQPGRGKKQKVEIPFAESLLKVGDNEVRITTLTGSWMLYDAVTLTGPAVELAGVQGKTLVEDVTAVRALQAVDGKLYRPVTVGLRHYGDNAQAVVRLGTSSKTVALSAGLNSVEMLAPEGNEAQLSVEAEGKVIATRTVEMKPVRKLTVYILPHSHTDIGYTEIQTKIEQKQVNNLLEGIEYAKKTADYPEGARFVWNVEVAWAADLYLRRLDEKQKADFLEAVKKGQVALNGMYLNELTGLCRPDELIRLFRFGTKVAQETGVPIESAMISDVPGYTWGVVPAMNQAGIKYFSTAPNYFDRIGTILREWENKPFYWVGPDGKSKVLVWIPFWGYAMSHRYGKMSPQLVDDFSDGLDKRGYPYDIAYVRWSGHGDNAVPDPAICDFVKDWNAKYAWPKFIISGTTAAFKAMEERYGKELPVVRGDWTPYWEDGAGSSARETSMNRWSSDRLTQAEAIFAMRAPKTYPAAAFEDAWDNVLLYSEHTWGADCSISQPESQKTREQWEIKKGYAEAAERASRELLAKSLPARGTAGQVDVVNTCSWARTGLVSVAAENSRAGDRVSDANGQAVASQRLSSGELVFLAKDVPGLGARRYTISAGEPLSEGKAVVEGASLSNGLVRVVVDEKTGGITQLLASGIEGNLADTSSGEAINEYLYLPGDKLSDLKGNGPVSIRVGEKGPLVASLIVESDAPGCRKLVREIRMVAGMDCVELVNTVDKARLEAKNYHADNGKESVNFGFPFAVPNGQVRLEVPMGVIRPDEDQMPSACKNWFTVGRWADVSNEDHGVTWVTLDAPLVEVGGITANLLNSQYNPDVWRKTVGPTQKIYSWAMNNHWGTNYRAYQEGPVTFRFVLRPHKKLDVAEATRFATTFSQPLIAAPAQGEAPASTPLLKLSTNDVVVLGIKPSDDGKAIIVRLFNASSEVKTAKMEWRSTPAGVYLSGTDEKAGEKVGDELKMAAFEVRTVRVEMP